MATKTHIELEDDLDGSEADETVQFGLDGVDYEIDLSEAHAKDLRGELEAYKAAARRVGKVQRQLTQRNAGAPARVDREQNQAIRAWAKKQGMTVNERGRIPGDITAKFHEAHPTGKAA